MTERLYYDDAYLWQFEAVVTGVRNGTRPGEWIITLDRSAFYPTSGGQPFDTGTLAFGKTKARVTNVEADSTGEVLHTVDREIPAGTPVKGEIDGERRTDHMEQHGGEHMLAGAIWEKLQGTTIGLHLGQAESSIDVSLPEGRTRLTEEEIQLLEETVNGRIRQDAPIRCWFPEEEELKKLPLRKPPTVTEHVRIVAMGDFEMVACGGTHPASTGRIGLMKIVSAIPAKGKVRVSFVCGGRAVKLFQTYMRYGDKAGAALSCPVDQLSRAASELKNRLAEAEKRANRLETKEILSRLAEAETGEDVPGRSEDVKIDMNDLIKRVARGGGRPDMASGAGIPECIGVARKILMTEGCGK